MSATVGRTETTASRTGFQLPTVPASRSRRLSRVAVGLVGSGGGPVWFNRPHSSVDRLSVAPQPKSLASADAGAANRGRTFYGWATVRADEAGRNGCDVVATPVPYTNPYHGDIVLPDSAASDREEQTRHAQELADASRWCPRPVS